MAAIKLTKNELRAQQVRLKQLQKYLPTLRLKKAMLQGEVQEARLEIASILDRFHQVRGVVEKYSGLLAESIGFDFNTLVRVESVNKHYENIAGVEVPVLEGIAFEELAYSLFETPAWLDTVVQSLKSLMELQVKKSIAEEKKEALEKELREVSIRVNLFEKILIPRALGNIKRIKVFLGDQELAAVSQAKVAKTKIEERKEMAHAH